MHSFLYSVIKSDRNSFCEDVVSDSFSMAYRDEDIILDRIYVYIQSNFFWIFIMTTNFSATVVLVFIFV